MKMRKWLCFSLLILMVMTLPLAGCGNQNVINSKTGLATVRIPDTYDPSSLYQPYIAAELGYFKEEGIDAEFTGVIGPGQHVAAVVAGTNDVGTMHVNRTINGIQAGAKIKAVVAGSETSKQYPHMSYVVLEDSPIRTAQDLLGKKVGIIAMGGCNEYTPYEWLRKNGIDEPRGKITLVQVPVGNEEQALRHGQVDVVGYHSVPSDVLSRGGIRILFDDNDVWGTVGGATPFYFSEKFINEHPDTVRHFVRAMARAQDWINANLDKAVELQAKRFNIDPKKIAVMYYAEHGIIKDDSIQLWIDVLKNYGEIKTDFKPQDIAINEFNDYATLH